MKHRYGRARLLDGREVFLEDSAGGAVLTKAPWLGGAHTGECVTESAIARRLCPVTPSKIVCVGRNYAAHAAELGNEVPEEPLLFFKPLSSLIGPDDAVELPPPELSTRVEHEVELGVVIGRRLKRASVEECRTALFGYTIVGDVTARDLQRRDKQWTRGKGLDTFCPVGPAVVTGVDTSSLRIRCSVDEVVRQDGSTSQMIFSPADLVAFISAAMTLEPGDLVVTGTPAGVGPLVDGNRMRLEIEELGQLDLPVRATI